MSVYDKYETVIGLEVHAQLQTNSKIFAPDSTVFGSEANKQVSYITLGHPGTLPVLNEKVVEYAVKMGLATHGKIEQENHFARKNYFYADLPKGYQISQDKKPICSGGYVRIKTSEGIKDVNLTRIHLEEDAGKSIHDQNPNYSLIDLNRAGVPLIEIVSEPDMRSSEEAYVYLSEIRRLVQYLDICDGNMEEGSLRCDANVSVRLRGSSVLGERVEVKNMNSLRYLRKAIDFESRRQIDLLESGQRVERQTRSFDAASETTFPLRNKETEDDYRYFPEPDLQPLFLSNEYIAKIKENLPPLPAELYNCFVQKAGLSEKDAHVLIESKQLALYYQQMMQMTNSYKSAANWLLGPVKSYLNEQKSEITSFPLSPSKLVELAHFTDSGKISFSAASQHLFPALLLQLDSDVEQLAVGLNLLMQSDNAWISGLLDEVLARFPEKVKEYQKGKKGLTGFFMGEAMRASKGKLDPQIATKLLLEKLG